MTSKVLSSSTRNVGICLQCRPYSVLQCNRLVDCCKSQGCFHPHTVDQLLAGETGATSSSRCIVLAMAVTPFKRSHMLAVSATPTVTVIVAMLIDEQVLANVCTGGTGGLHQPSASIPVSLTEATASVTSTTLEAVAL